MTDLFQYPGQHILVTGTSAIQYTDPLGCRTMCLPVLKRLVSEQWYINSGKTSVLIKLSRLYARAKGDNLK